MIETDVSVIMVVSQPMARFNLFKCSVMNVLMYVANGLNKEFLTLILIMDLRTYKPPDV